MVETVGESSTEGSVCLDPPTGPSVNFDASPPNSPSSAEIRVFHQASEVFGNMQDAYTTTIESPLRDFTISENVPFVTNSTAEDLSRTPIPRSSGTRPDPPPSLWSKATSMFRPVSKHSNKKTCTQQSESGPLGPKESPVPIFVPTPQRVLPSILPTQSTSDPEPDLPYSESSSSSDSKSSDDSWRRRSRKKRKKRHASAILKELMTKAENFKLPILSNHPDPARRRAGYVTFLETLQHVCQCVKEVDDVLRDFSNPPYNQNQTW